MPRELILDTNLAVLLVVGAASPAYIDDHRRLQAFAREDYHLLRRCIGRYSGLLFTPAVLAETSNLLGRGDKPRQREIIATFKTLIETSVEIHVPSIEAVRHEAFRRLGLTDAGMLERLASGGTLLTADFDLWHGAKRLGLAALNFTHLREQAFDL